MDERLKIAALFLLNVIFLIAPPPFSIGGFIMLGWMYARMYSMQLENKKLVKSLQEQVLQE